MNAENKQDAPAAGKGVDDAMVERALEAQGEYWDDATKHLTCEACKGSGEDRADGDWCGDCGGQGMYFDGDESGAMRAALEAALTRQPVAGDGKITLTAAEISDLAEFVGLRATLLNEIEPDTEIDVYPCPAEGVRNEGEPSDPDSRSHYRYVAVMSEYPEEGCCGLGDEIAAPAATPTDGGEG